MALDLDAFAVLSAIGSHAKLFDPIRTDASKAARALVVKRIKGKDASLATVRNIRDALGPENFALVVDGLKDAELKTLAAKLDKENAELKEANAALRRRHILALAAGDAEPLPKQPKPKKAAKAAPRKKQGAKEPEFLADESAGAVRKR